MDALDYLQGTGKLSAEDFLKAKPVPATGETLDLSNVATPDIANAVPDIKGIDVTGAPDPNEKKTPAWVKAADFLTGHFPHGDEADKPEVVAQPSGKIQINVPQTAEMPFLQDPVTAGAFGLAKGLRVAEPLVKKIGAGAREAVGWLTGGASEVPVAAKGGLESIVKTIKEPLGEKGAVNPELLTLGAEKFIKDDVLPTSKSVYETVKQSSGDIRNLLSPSSVGEQAKDTANILRENLAEMARSTDQAQYALDKARNYFQKQTPEYNFDFIDKIEKGEQHGDIFLGQTANIMRDLLDKKAEEVRALGTGKLESLIENYFPHMWQDPAKANEVFMQWFAKRPMEGSKSFLKQRTIPTTKEGLEAGLVPVSSNPVDMTILKLKEMDKYIMAQKTLASMKEQGLAKFVRSGAEIPEGLAPINDKISKVYVPVDKYGRYVTEQAVRESSTETTQILRERITELARSGAGAQTNRASRLMEDQVKDALLSRGRSEAEALQIINRIKQAPAGEAVDRIIEKETQKTINRIKEIRTNKEWIPGKGFVNVGNYYAPDNAARVINNYLSPGLRSNQAFRAYLGSANLLNQAQLGLSAFHLGFTSLDAMISKFALGLNQAVHTDFGKALKSFAQVPIAPVENILRGNKLYKEWMMPGTENADIGKLVDAVVKSGGRAKMDRFYATEWSNKAVDAFRNGNIIGGILRTPFALVDASAKPIMEYIVPRQKLGVFADLAKYELERLSKKGAGEKEITDTLTKIWDSVDNRMGQLVYDNLFWNKAIKDLGMASVRSLGWNLGTIREVGGGAIDTVKAIGNIAKLKSPELTYRMAYTASLPVITGILGGSMHYMMTGEAPKELRDYFFPQTGRLDEAGRPERISLPSYMKDLYHYYQEPAQTVKNKLHPALSAVFNMLDNKDFYGVQIADWSEGVAETLKNPQTYKDYAEFAGKTVMPFGIRNLLRERQTGATGMEQVLPFIGITPAPSSISRTPAENLMSDLLKGRRPSAPITKEQQETYDVKRQILSSLKSGNPVDPDTMAKLGNFSTQQINNLFNDAIKNTFTNQYEHLTLREALQVYEIAKPEEKQLALPILVKRIQSGMNNKPNEVQKLLPRIQRALSIQ